MKSPDFVKIVEAHGLTAIRVTERSQVKAAIQQARENPGSVVIEFIVEKEDSVYPMVPAGADLDEMIRRPASTQEQSYP
jgi:acetolactate synthase-1/2/3 large subunit